MQSHHVYASMFYHLVWSTKSRQPIIKLSFKKSLYKHLGKIIGLKSWHLLAVGGTENHIHLLIQKNCCFTISDVVRYLKSNSSKFVRDNFDNNFAWQSGYGVFTVDLASLPRIKNYILNQEKHHKDMMFEKEYVLLLKKFKITYDLDTLFE